ncbi:hypothetical protein B0H34DRAFT_201947 [Crassisporium funariophilum]|nr:hypothetical protein B0H34DRAFT_201947 [Crassisporium funariophilum]
MHPLPPAISTRCLLFWSGPCLGPRPSHTPSDGRHRRSVLVTPEHRPTAILLPKLSSTNRRSALPIGPWLRSSVDCVRKSDDGTRDPGMGMVSPRPLSEVCYWFLSYRHGIASKQASCSRMPVSATLAMLPPRVFPHFRLPLRLHFPHPSPLSQIRTVSISTTHFSLIVTQRHQAHPAPQPYPPLETENTHPLPSSFHPTTFPLTPPSPHHRFQKYPIRIKQRNAPASGVLNASWAPCGLANSLQPAARQLELPLSTFTAHHILPFPLEPWVGSPIWVIVYVMIANFVHLGVYVLSFLVVLVGPGR